MLDFLTSDLDKLDEGLKNMRVMVAKAREYDVLKKCMDVVTEKADPKPEKIGENESRIILTIKKGFYLDTLSAIEKAEVRIEQAGKDPDPKEVT